MPAASSGFREDQCMGEAEANFICLGTEDLEYENPENIQRGHRCRSKGTKPTPDDEIKCVGDISKLREELSILECTIDWEEGEACRLQASVTKLTALQTDTAQRLRSTCKRLSHANATENKKLREVVQRIKRKEQTLRSKLAQKDDEIKKTKAQFASRDQDLTQAIEKKREVLSGLQCELDATRKELGRFQNSSHQKICRPINVEKQTSQYGSCRMEEQLDGFHRDLSKIRQDKCEMESVIQECSDDLGRAVRLPNEIQHIKRFLRSLHVCDNSNRNTTDDFDEDMVLKARQIIQMQQKLLEIHETTFMLQVKLKDMCCKDKIFRIAAAADEAVFRHEEPVVTNRAQEPARTSACGVVAETPLWTACVLNPSGTQTSCCPRTEKATGVNGCKAEYKQEEPGIAGQPCEASWAEAFLQDCSQKKQETSSFGIREPLIRIASFLQSETEIRRPDQCRVASLPVSQKVCINSDKNCHHVRCKCDQRNPKPQKPSTPCWQNTPREATLEEDRLFLHPPRTAETLSPCPARNEKENLPRSKPAAPQATEKACQKNEDEEHYAFRPLISKRNFAKPVNRTSKIQVRENRPSSKKQPYCVEVSRNNVCTKPAQTEVRKPECGLANHPTTLHRAKSSTGFSSSASEIPLRRRVTERSRRPKQLAPKQEDCRKPTIPAEFVGPCCGKACEPSGIANTGFCRSPHPDIQTPPNSDNVSDSRRTSDVWSTCAASSGNASSPAGETTESDDEASCGDTSAKKSSSPALQKNWNQIARSLLTSPAQETYARLMAERPVTSNRHPFRHCHTPLESCDDFVDTSFSAAELLTSRTRSACETSP